MNGRFETQQLFDGVRARSRDSIAASRPCGVPEHAESPLPIRFIVFSWPRDKQQVDRRTQLVVIETVTLVLGAGSARQEVVS